MCGLCEQGERRLWKVNNCASEIGIWERERSGVHVHVEDDRRVMGAWFLGVSCRLHDRSNVSRVRV